MGAFVGNPVQVTYTYGTEISNTVILYSSANTVLLTYPLVSINVFTNREYAHIGNMIQYKIVIENKGTMDVFNNSVTFYLNSFLELVPNTLYVNGKRSADNLVNISIPNLLVGSQQCVIIFTALVVKSSFCQYWKIKSKATIRGTYDGNSTLEVTSETADTIVEKPKKLYQLKEKLIMPCIMPEINRILNCQVYLLSVCPIAVRDGQVLIKVSYAAEIVYCDNTKQRLSYYQTYEKYLKFNQGCYPYVVCIAVDRKEILDNHQEMLLFIEISIFDKIASGLKN
ncbi:hypothetical protein [Anaeromicropila herbilytica]|uniref:DUF11 domain-containing protein n=1 Tax=Anaeromicropila herbilytica TaxID=2785025 RepID=A0A7R7EK38_9FIRM|nr:hypothetical protein [Anaeromicropila herbilytica]BCN30326.1 hypothetical protein bsdtb5_16210 [Anaeromicropila herbilytica]